MIRPHVAVVFWPLIELELRDKNERVALHGRKPTESDANVSG